jgi:hypothetical protein
MKPEIQITELKRVIEQLLEHLEWIGWGDSWERECSEDIRDEIEALRKEGLL